jgi:hypothetical protein
MQRIKLHANNQQVKQIREEDMAINANNIKACDLKNKVEFFTGSGESFEDFDEQESQWRLVCRKFVSIQPFINFGLGNVETVSFGQVITESIYLVTMRYDSRITCHMRMKYGGRIFDVSRLVYLGRRGRFMQLIVKEITQ